ncbi:MAG: Fe-S cluster assembly protein HesB [Candidatus Thorarchaeota archaeon]|jgi:A/G-specific adenine glycosylase
MSIDCVKYSGADVSAFQERIMQWWDENARDLPWRCDSSPYNVLVSEVMLQQTQVNRVVPKYLEFLNQFPTLEVLAAADTKELLQIWSGLGYNRRALWLREAARQIMVKNEFPNTVEELRNLKGVGPYTSRSILIFAFNKDLAAVDTNIRRVLIASGFADEEMSSSQLQQVADDLLLKGRSCDWHNALMDYGALVITSSSTGVSPQTKQPRFKGSTRQLRGAIIRILTKSHTLSLNELISNLNSENIQCKDVNPVLNQLLAEGFVERTDNGRFKIVD